MQEDQMPQGECDQVMLKQLSDKEIAELNGLKLIDCLKANYTHHLITYKSDASCYFFNNKPYQISFEDEITNFILTVFKEIKNKNNRKLIAISNKHDSFYFISIYNADYWHNKYLEFKQIQKEFLQDFE